ncbi:MAG: hypothetical protein RL685_2350 [Pseudomonadota bacterium]|jgi:hypothetical protein
MHPESPLSFSRTLIGHAPLAERASPSLPSLQRALQSLRDIEGVYGSFILDGAGKPLARDLPGVFDDYTLAESGERITRLWTVLSESAPPEYTSIEFAEYSLFLRGLFARGQSVGCLCVVVPPTVNLLALRLASKWVARTFDADSSSHAAPA